MDLTLRLWQIFAISERVCTFVSVVPLPHKQQPPARAPLRGRSRRASTALRLPRFPAFLAPSWRWISRYQHPDEELLHFEVGSLYGLKNALSRDASESTSPRSRASWLSPPPSPFYGFDVTKNGFDVTLYGFDVTLYGFDVTPPSSQLLYIERVTRI